MAAAGARRRGRRDAEAAAGIAALEGYLLWQAETEQAWARARGFTERLPWLTTAQGQEVERAYVSDHLDHAERALRTTALRCQELRAEYRCAYTALCRRLTAGFALALSVLVALTALLLAAR